MLRSLWRKKESVDMTQGPILSHLILFAIPLLVGNLFQQFYNMVDTWVVGNFASNEAFSAVGSVGSIINMIIGFFVGFSSGTGVVISQYFGAGKEEKVKETVQTAILFTLLFGIALTVLALLLVPLMLTLMKTPPEVMPEAENYLYVYFSGLLGLMIYNIGSGILRAVGDSRRPLYFLIATSVINVVLDLLLVKPMGVRGVALATITAQAVSAVLVILTLLRTKSCIRLSFEHLRFNFSILRQIFTVGVPAGIQMVITAFSNVFVQSYINVYGSDYMAGWTAYGKLDSLLFLPMQSFALSATTFVGQNLGKQQTKRAKQGSNIALLSAMGVTAVLILPIVLFPTQLVSFFNDKPEVVEIGSMLLRYITPFYILCTVNQVYSASLRGAGNSRAPMIVMLCSFVLFRQIFLFVISRALPGNFLAVAMSYPAGWLVCSLSIFIYYRLTPLTSRLKGITDQPKASEG